MYQLPKSLYEHLKTLAEKDPKRIAILQCDHEGKIHGEITYEELFRMIERAAGYLVDLGLQKGDRVALSFRNSAELLILSWSAWSCGIVTVPLDTKRDTGELYKYKIDINKAKLLIAQEGTLKNIESKYLEGLEVKEFTRFPQYRGIQSPDMWEDDLSHLALILFTSGTTGYPKGARLSLENLLVNADGIRQWLHITKEDRFFVNLPLHHINSTTFCLSALLAGGSIVITPNYSNSHFWKQMASSGATITSVVQSILFDQVGRDDEYTCVKKDLHLNRIQIGSAPVVVHTMQEFMKKFGIPLYQGYGQTETALRVTGVPMGLPPDLYERLVEENSIGVAMPWADVQISDERGVFLGEGIEGELVVKGPAVMEGYVTKESAIREGYFLSGDIGYFKIIAGQKYYYLKGRKREIIIKGGVNISPVAIENALKKISPEIDQVYVVPVSDDRYGEEAGAVICWKAGIDEAAAKRRLKLALLFGTPYVSVYETPKYLTTFDVAELPMTSTGKVQRSVLKTTLPYERFESIFGLFKMRDRRFTVLHRYSRWVNASFALYTQCWGELSPTREDYEKSIPLQLIILAADAGDKLLGQIAVVRTSISESYLLRTTYDALLTPSVIDPKGDSLVCISICSSDYEPKPVPNVTDIPSRREVRQYLDQGFDPVMRFHRKPKGGLVEGASLVDVIPRGRPEDSSALGYNMLIKYPSPAGGVIVSESAPVSQQLLEMALLSAHDLGIENVFAFSRPGGLASHMAQHVR